MLYNKKLKVFGPKQPSLDYLHGPIYQRGEGLGSFLSNIFRKIIPVAASAVKKIAPIATKTVKNKATSDIVRDTSKQLKNHLTSAATDALGDIIEGKDPMLGAKEKLNEARTQIANTIRAKSVMPIKEEDLEKKRNKKLKKYTKRKKVTYLANNKKKRTNYNIFDED